MPGSVNRLDEISGNSVRRSALLIIAAFTVLASRSVLSMPSKSSSSVEFSKVELQPTTHSKADRSPYDGDYSRAKRQNFAGSGHRGSHDAKDVVLYPGDVDHRRSKISFVPEIDPECVGKTFCAKSTMYPTDYVNNHLNVLNQFKQFDKVDEIEIGTRHDDTDDPTTSLCVSIEQIVHPKAAETRNKEWLFVINDDNLKQGVRIETCQGDQESRCNHFGELAAGYKTMCKQKYIYRQLVGISTNGTIAPNMFRLPASCCCHLKFEPGTSSRVGVDNENNKPKPKSND